MEKRLWYNRPADDWQEGLPIGCGRLAAMVMGNPRCERVSLNHEWLWRGKNRFRDTEDRSHYLPKVRELLVSGDYEGGTLLANEAFAGKGGVSGEQSRVDSYQPAGDLYFELGHEKVHNYYRELDLEQALVRVTYETNNTKIIREIIAHHKYKMLMIRISSEQGKVDSTFWLDRILDPECKISFTNHHSKMVMEGMFQEGIEFRVEATLFSDGGDISMDENNRIQVRDSKEILVFVNIGTSSKGESPATECSRYTLPEPDWNKLLNEHVEEYDRHYGELELSLQIESDDLPTDQRLAKLREGNEDPGLPLLYFNYGRYLLCSSAADCDLPVNLQGKWNEELNPPWQCDYHHDINLQMCYWLAEQGHLQHCTESLFAYMERLVPHARKVAKDLYGCNGVYFPLQTDAWSRATPESYGWAVWVGAAAWLAQHMWWHYEFGQDIHFLRDRAYPFFKEVADFYESYLMEDDNGEMIIVPSQSPENRFTASGELPVSIGVSSSMDIQLVVSVLSHAIRSSELLEVDIERRRKWKEILSCLPSMRIGSKGQLCEWNEEFVEAEPGHRHISHLFGLYPGDQISRDRTPELFRAAEISLEQRLGTGGGHTGWSRAWTACCYARLGNGEKAWRHMRALITDFATDSLLDLHPPNIFQIEGNLGGAAAITEMLLQSYHEELHFLPALPTAWPSGEIRGLRARGGYTVNLAWNRSQLISAEVVSLNDRICTVKQENHIFEVLNENGEKVPHHTEGTNIKFPVKGGQQYFVRLKG